MILGFSHTNPFTREKTDFVDKILSGTKIHSLRIGQRWKPGMRIQMATGVRTRNYKQFNTDRDDLKTCISTQNIEIMMSQEYMNDCTIIVDGKTLTTDEMVKLAHYDGFDDLYSFLLWFSKAEKMPTQIIHWTNFKY